MKRSASRERERPEEEKRINHETHERHERRQKRGKKGRLASTAESLPFLPFVSFVCFVVNPLLLLRSLTLPARPRADSFSLTDTKLSLFGEMGGRGRLL